MYAEKKGTMWKVETPSLSPPKWSLHTTLPPQSGYRDVFPLPAHMETPPQIVVQHNGERGGEEERGPLGCSYSLVAI